MMRMSAMMALALTLGASMSFAQQDATSVQSADPVKQEATPDELKIHFGSGQATLAGDQTAVLDQAARLYREGSPLVMIVAGSADTVGSAERNLDLSIRRAQVVAFALADRGIPIARLQVLGRGNSELAVPTDSGVANAENRTVSITWR